jgi:phosphate transport system protein
MATEPATSTRVLHLLFVAKHIERIGDYVKDICELTVYMIEAEFIKHSFEKTSENIPAADQNSG